ncbi:Mediator Of Rna polymerase Ii Transcription Subunit 12-Like Protein [Manis pentadactyla]|nr:Mediator Of Rna polymerase Ii Transcription Subunit 12-Like Protein [Manis pentadactyla]
MLGSCEREKRETGSEGSEAPLRERGREREYMLLEKDIERERDASERALRLLSEREILGSFERERYASSFEERYDKLFERKRKKETEREKLGSFDGD